KSRNVVDFCRFCLGRGGGLKFCYPGKWPARRCRRHNSRSKIRAAAEQSKIFPQRCHPLAREDRSTPKWPHPDFSRAQVSKTGRIPYESDDRIAFGAANRRLRPPKTLSGAERKAFVALVAASPIGQFTQADVPLLLSWVETEAQARRAAAEIALAGG